jgi:RHS repeat-associated protein
MHNLCRIRGKAGNMLKKMSRHGRVHTPRTPQTETFLWDGLALIRRNDEHFINEPHVGNAPKKLRFEGKPRAQRSARRARKGPRGNPVASSKGTSYFNDALGTTIGAKKDGKYSAAALTAFGERLDNVDSTSPAIRSLGEGWFTGKPFVEGLGHAFLMRNYRAGLAKWQSADPMGYPDGWNQLAYCNNAATSAVDLWGCERNVGDIEYIDMNPDEYFALLGLGGKALPLEREGFDSEWLGAGRSHIEIQGSRHSAVANGIETTWAMFADYENFARWSVYFVSVEFTVENFRSRLCSLAESGGKITDAICKVLLVFGVPASVEVKVGAKISSIIGSLEDLMKDRVTIGLGRYKVCDELYESCCRKYEEIVSVAFIKE